MAASSPHPILHILNCAAWLQPLPSDLHGNQAAFQVHPMPKGKRRLLPIPSLFPGGWDTTFHRGQEGRKSWGPSVLSPLFLNLRGSRRFLRLRGLVTRMGMGVGVWSRLGARPVFTLHVDVQALVTGLLATSLAAAVYNLLHQFIHSGHLLMARALQGHLGGAGGRKGMSPEV